MASNSPPLVLSLLRKSMEWDGKKYEILDGFYRENWGRWEGINGLEREDGLNNGVYKTTIVINQIKIIVLIPWI